MFVVCVCMHIHCNVVSLAEALFSEAMFVNRHVLDVLLLLLVVNGYVLHFSTFLIW